ncbi:MAG: tryptophan--tRNA ligase [Candidatus Kerfeldbacteria bacterium]
MKQRILSGIQPSGELHIGNYLGAIRQWVEMQKKYDSYFCIVDLHAITARQDPEELRANIRKTAAVYLACGVDPKQSAIFVQSTVPAHAELAWVLSTFTQMGELERMTQFKDKVGKQKKEGVGVGLYTYPVLMAADILLYKADAVPVGEDQKQHVELTRNIAERFNNHYDREVFTVPEPFMPKAGARIMGLDDPANKMSKSAASANNYISLFDDMDVVRKKIMKAVTDTGSEVKAGKNKPALTNLLTIYSAVTGTSVAGLEKEYNGKGYADFKAGMADAVIAWLEPLQQEVNSLLKDEGELERILDDGRERAQEVASQTLADVYDTIGLGY